jgi:hypothetical protein
VSGYLVGPDVSKCRKFSKYRLATRRSETHRERRRGRRFRAARTALSSALTLRLQWEDSHALPKFDPCSCSCIASRVADDLGAQAHDEAKYPNVKGLWNRFVVPGLPGQRAGNATTKRSSMRITGRTIWKCPCLARAWCARSVGPSVPTCDRIGRSAAGDRGRNCGPPSGSATIQRGVAHLRAKFRSPSWS